MKKSIILSFAIFVFAAFTFCQAQAATCPTYDLSLLHKKVTLPAGTLILLETNEALDASTLTLGQTVQFKVKANVVADGRTVVNAGATAIGRVKALGQPSYNRQGTVTIEVTYVQAADGQQIRANGTEQTYKSKFPNTDAMIEKGADISAQTMNEVVIKV